MKWTTPLLHVVMRAMMAGILPTNHLYDFTSLFIAKATTFLLLFVIIFRVITIGGVMEPAGCSAMLLLLPPPQSPPSSITTTAIVRVRTDELDTECSMHFGWKFSHEKRWLHMP
jgi:hypothetical protein